MDAGRIIGVFLVYAFLSSCGGQARQGSEAQEADLTLRSYDVPGGNATQVQTLLRTLFVTKSDEKPVARASVGPDGRLVVLATDRIHRGVAELLNGLAKQPAVAAPQSVQISYWFVIGKKTQAKESGASVSPELADIANALSEISKRERNVEFSLLEKIKLASIVNRGASLNGRDVSVTQNAAVSGDKVIADLSLETQGQRRPLSTEVQLVPGETLVLGETGCPVQLKKAGETCDMLFYVIQAMVLGAKTSGR